MTDDRDKYLYCTETVDADGNAPGWYFRDEEGDLHGPFETRDETLENFTVYCDWWVRHA